VVDFAQREELARITLPEQPNGYAPDYALVTSIPIKVTAVIPVGQVARGGKSSKGSAVEIASRIDFIPAPPSLRLSYRRRNMSPDHMLVVRGRSNLPNSGFAPYRCASVREPGVHG
jgi:hypothetical protein